MTPPEQEPAGMSTYGTSQGIEATLHANRVLQPCIGDGFGLAGVGAGLY